MQVIDPLLPACALGCERGGLVGASPFRQQLTQVGMGFGEDLGVVGDPHAVELGIVIRHLADENRRVIKVGGGDRHFPFMGFRKAMLTRQFDVLDEQRDVLGDDAVVRGVLPFPLLHGAYYRRARIRRHSFRSRYVMYQGLSHFSGSAWPANL